MKYQAFVLVVCGLMVASLGAAEKPALQPFPRECTWGEGVVEAAGLSVVRDDVRQCEIGAAELPTTGGRRVFADEDIGKCVFLAVEGSPLATKLAAAFSLDVPQKRQGYALVVENGGVAVVGHDAIGALYGAMTLRQLMADGGKIPSVRIRDWPDFAWRGSLDMWHGIRGWGEAATRRKQELDVPAVKAGFDEMMRHKLNTFFGFHSSYSYPTDPKVLAEYREVFAYARERGIRPQITIFESVYSHLYNPKNLKGANDWDCVYNEVASAKRWLCWSRDEEFGRMALWWVKYLKDIGAEDAFIQIHPRDTGGKNGMDPEEFSMRCAKCRERYGDDERWKATANKLNIWNRIFKRELPNCSVGSCVQPYLLSCVFPPEGADGESYRVWKRDTVDYWRQLSSAIEDPKLWFSSWACKRACIDEYRKTVSKRPYKYGATYTANPGVFMTSSRRLGTVFEGGDDESFSETASIKQGHWEAMFLTGEYMWNTKAPGWTEFDGQVWYDPLADHTGPDVVMQTILPAICRTFWGEKIGPAMVDFLASGVLPQYLAEPVNTIGEWNYIRKNAMYDPTGGSMSGSGNKVPLPPIVDNAELVNGQVAAAERALDALERARPFMDELPSHKRTYFGFYLRRAPYWLATARVRAAIFAAYAALEKGSPDGGLPIITAIRPVAERDFAAADANARALNKARMRDRVKFMTYGMTLDEAKRDLDKAERLAKSSVRMDDEARSVRKARIVAEAGVQPNRAVGFPVEPDEGSVVWEGEHVIDSPVVLDKKSLYLKSGAKVIFRGEGRLEVRYAGFYASNAAFEAKDGMTGNFRIFVKRGDLWLDNCRFTNLKCEKSSHWGSGFVRMESYRRSRRPMIVRHCTFTACSSISCNATGDSEITNCLFDGCDRAICTLVSLNTIIEGNVIRDVKEMGLELRQSDLANVIGNVFEKGPVAAQYSLSRNCRMIGNFYSDCTPYCAKVEGKSKALIEPKRINE